MIEIDSALRDVRNMERKIESHKKTACIASDCEKIIGAIPDLHPGKAEEASLILFSLYTGARAVSSTNVLLGDFVPSLKRTRFVIRITKGNKNFNHPVNIVRDEEVP